MASSAILKREYRGGVWVLIDLDLAALSGKSKRINITLPERVLRHIDRHTQVRGGNRSAFLAEAAIRAISQDKY